MKKFYIAIAIIVAAAAAVSGALMLREKPQWTTSSDTALAEFQLGREDEMKLYRIDAHAHYKRAVELDPDFVMARVRAALTSPETDRKKLEAELRTMKIDHLTEREQFLVRFLISGLDREKESHLHARKQLDEYLEQHPKDPVVLSIKCEGLWQRREWDNAEKCYGELVEVDPNYVIAHNNLGYLKMAQGRFAEAEESFTMYRYIAPDQANPHDSLGELLTLLGRYDEAEREIEEALRVRPDFCASFEHLAMVHLLNRQYEKARSVIERVSQQPSCPGVIPEWLRCQADIWELVDNGDVVGAGKRGSSPDCPKTGGEAFIFPHAAALEEGRSDDAHAIEKMVAAGMEKSKDDESVAILYHLRGMRLLREGDALGAVSQLTIVDNKLDYSGNGRGLFKLYNRTALALVLRKSGNAKAADAILAQLDAVNPKYRTRFNAMLGQQ